MYQNWQKPFAGCRWSFFLGGGIAFIAASGCSTNTKLTKDFKVEMYGVYEEATDATGTYAPIWQEYSLIGVNLTKSDGTDEALYTDPPKIFKIVNRPQIIFKKDLTDYDGTTFLSATVEFDSTIKAASKLKDDHEVTLTTSSVTTAETVTVEGGQSGTVIIKVKWQNTVTRDDAADTDTMTEPTLAAKVE